MSDEWYLVRPGVRMMGQWAPDTFAYPFRFEGPKVGDTVYIIIRHKETREFKVAEDKIVMVDDCHDSTLAVNDEGWFIDEKTGTYALAKDHGQTRDRSEYLIDYWIETYNPGHGLTFGDVLFETAEDAQEILDDILANVDKWDGKDDDDDNSGS